MKPKMVTFADDSDHYYDYMAVGIAILFRLFDQSSPQQSRRLDLVLWGYRRKQYGNIQEQERQDQVADKVSSKGHNPSL